MGGGVEDAVFHLDDGVEDIDRFISNLQDFSVTAKEVGKDLSTFATDAKAIPPDVREAVANLNARIDDLGAIIAGLKNSFPLNMVTQDPKAPVKPPPKK